VLWIKGDTVLGGRVSVFFAEASGIVLICPTPIVNKKNEKVPFCVFGWGLLLQGNRYISQGALGAISWRQATKISAHCLRNHLTKLHSIGTGGIRYQIQTYPCACFKCKNKKCSIQIDADIQELFRD
jgi:hypothetical protein